MNTTAIKSMKLYSRVERIYDELRNIGIGEDDPLTVADLLPFDQYHYFGTLAVDEGGVRGKRTGQHNPIIGRSQAAS